MVNTKRGPTTAGTGAAPKLQVSMNDDDIVWGVRGDACGNPLARAAGRAARRADVGFAGRVHVNAACHSVEMDIQDGAGGIRTVKARLPKNVGRWVLDFDASRPVGDLEPFELAFAPA